MSRKNWGALGCAAFVTAAIAFPAGMMFGRRQAPPQEGMRGNAAPSANYRKIYSPDIHNDPHVQAEWEKVVEELQAQCRHTGERCTEAKAARRALNERW